MQEDACRRVLPSSLDYKQLFVSVYILGKVSDSYQKVEGSKHI
jgi:hypothetical protein